MLQRFRYFRYGICDHVSLAMHCQDTAKLYLQLIECSMCLGAIRNFQSEVEARAEKDRKRSDVVGASRPLPAQTPAPRKIKGAVYGSDEQVLVDEPDISLQVSSEPYIDLSSFDVIFLSIMKSSLELKESAMILNLLAFNRF